MNENKQVSLNEATLKVLSMQLDGEQEIKDVEGIIDGTLVVTDPEILNDEYDEIIEKAQEIIEDTPEGDIPFDEEFIGNYALTCPICGQTFFNDTILEPGSNCLICGEVPEAFIVRGRLESEDQVEYNNNLDILNDEEFNDDIDIDLTQEPEEPIEVAEDEEERVVASEEVKSADNKLQENKDSFSDTFINSVKKGGYKPLKYCRETGDNSFEEKMSAKELMDIYNNLNNIYSNLYSKNMTDKADEEELFDDIQYWEDRLKKLHENKEMKAASTRDLEYKPTIGDREQIDEVMITLNKLWDTILEGESPYFGQFKDKIAEAIDSIEEIQTSIDKYQAEGNDLIEDSEEIVYKENKVEESITEEEAFNFEAALEDCEDMDDIQDLILNISDAVLEEECQNVYDLCLQDGDELDVVKSLISTAYEDNAEYEEN